MNHVLVIAGFILHMLGILSAVHAVMRSRASQAATAWSISLITFPYLMLPLYWLFGIYQERTHVDVKALRARSIKFALAAKSERTTRTTHEATRLGIFEKLGGMPETNLNSARLLIDGEETFSAIFSAIESAKTYIALEFFIVTPDELGQELKRLLIKKAGEGVKVFFLYDPVGSRYMTKAYLRELRAAGVDIRPFKVREHINRFQINFRNHRKIVVVDGHTAFIGGHNVGEEYLGKAKRFGHWRDTHICLQGPVTASIQAAFISDWYLTTELMLDLNWQKCPHKNGLVLEGPISCVVVSSDPLDGKDLAGMSFTQAIHMAQERVWIASPYFIPDEKITAALKLKALDGVDVRILLPDMADHFLVYMAAYSYLEDLKDSGVRIFRYSNGFLHQKVMLVDQDLSCVGTANLDNRSFHLNFEQMVFMSSEKMNEAVYEMLLKDFSASVELKTPEYGSKPFLFRLMVRVARLFSPIL